MAAVCEAGDLDRKTTGASWRRRSPMACGRPLVTEQVDKKFCAVVDDARMAGEIRRRRHESEHFHNALYAVERFEVGAASCQ